MKWLVMEITKNLGEELHTTLFKPQELEGGQMMRLKIRHTEITHYGKGCLVHLHFSFCLRS